MTARTKLWISFAGIIALTVLAGVVDYPKGPDLRIGNIDRELKVHLGLDLQGGTSLLYNADVTEIPEADRANSLEGVRDVIEQRINAFGVGEPNIQTVRNGEDWRVLVELPGVTDITEAVNKIGETPLLEFKVEGEPPELTEEELAVIREQNDAIREEAQSVLERARNGEDFATLATEFSEDTVSSEDGGSLGEFSEGDMVPEFNDVVFGSAPVGEVHPELVQTDFGYHVVLVEERNEAPATEDSQENTESEESAEGDEASDEASDEATEETTEDEETEEAKATATARHILFRTIPEESQFFGPSYVDTDLTGEQLERADVTFDPNTGLPTVSLAFNKEGRDLFAQLTADHLGETIAIYLDGVIISAPVVQSEILNGEAVISGDFTLEETKELAQRLNAGALPVPIELISQNNVGPTLGQESIQRSLFAGAIGLLALALFMIVYYRLPGLLAVAALAIYFAVLLAVYKLWPVTLTLSGIAGTILSIGIAVDANVLIFERTREELRSGKSVPKSVEDGFTRAWSSIRDSNVSSLITCLILYWFGSSLIRGFAITLAIGIVLSMFSAITITRTFMRLAKTQNPWWYGIKRPKKADQN